MTTTNPYRCPATWPEIIDIRYPDGRVEQREIENFCRLGPNHDGAHLDYFDRSWED